MITAPIPEGGTPQTAPIHSPTPTMTATAVPTPTPTVPLAVATPMLTTGMTLILIGILGIVGAWMARPKP